MDRLFEEYKLEFGQLPVEPDSDQIFYVGMGLNPALDCFVKNHIPELKLIFDNCGVEFVFMPAFEDEISPDDFEASVLFYMPWLKEDDLEEVRHVCHDNVNTVFSGLKLKDGKPAVVNVSGRAFMLDIPKPESRLCYDIFSQIAAEFMPKFNNEPHIIDDDVRFSVTGLFDEKPRYAVKACLNSLMDLFDADGESFQEGRDKELEKNTQTCSEDPEIMRMFRRVVETRPSWAVKAMLAKMLEADEVISRLVITRQCKLLLPDYNDMEIKLTPKEKAIYILYLKHPEGITFKNLPDYRDELGRYYRHVTGRDDPKAIDETIDKMVISINGDADVQRARIKYAINKAFTSQFCEQYAHYYTIEGSRGEALKVELPREKVIWEADI